MTFVYLFLGLLTIFLAAELFTNAIEWFGKHMKVSEGAVGSVLAAVGTALPETSVAIVAVTTGGKAHTEAGIGAMLGAPMMLSTLAMFITGASVLVFSAMKIRKKTIRADYRVVGRDLRSFFLVYLLALMAALVHVRAGKIAIAALLLAIYIGYVYKTFKCPDCNKEEQSMRPLHFHRSAAKPGIMRVIIQLAAGVALMLFGARMFVDNVTIVAQALGVSALVLSLIITPIATELPEKFNSITWMRHKKDTLALGNVTGAMVFQSSVLPAIGILLTPWILDAHAIISIMIAVLATFFIWMEMMILKRISPYSLLMGGVMYLLYPIAVFVILPALKIHP
ncbi:MAG: sodium:calcium antiporter [Armatimonadota bacterium]|nr:sodium:calcium antiporter [bacterium]